jgi:hypothetical protein
LDSGIYLTRRGPQLLLTVEHRRAPAPPAFFVRLEANGPPHLALLEPEPDAREVPSAVDPLRAAVLEKLREKKRPSSARELRDALRVRKTSLLDALRALASQGLIARRPEGWVLSQSEK